MENTSPVKWVKRKYWLWCRESKWNVDFSMFAQIRKYRLFVKILTYKHKNILERKIVNCGNNISWCMQTYITKKDGDDSGEWWLQYSCYLYPPKHIVIVMHHGTRKIWQRSILFAFSPVVVKIALVNDDDENIFTFLSTSRTYFLSEEICLCAWEQEILFSREADVVQCK